MLGFIAFRADGVALAESLPTDCDNNGIVNAMDFKIFTPFFNGPIEGSSNGCHCFDIDRSDSVDLRDFAELQRSFGTSPQSPEPPPSNLFVLQLADYHDRCAAGDGGDRRCHVGDACCQVQTGAPNTPCAQLENLWVKACDANADGFRDRLADLDTLAEWNDAFWEPDDTCNLLAREHYSHNQTDKPFTRHFIPMCTDGSTPPKGTTVCPDGQPIIQCTDGSRPVFFYHPGTVDRWIIKIQGGGMTCSGNPDNPAGDCWEDAGRSHYSSAWGGNPATNAFRGMYNANNSHFADYNLVIIDKCVGDRNLGSNTIPLQNFFADNGTPKGQGPVYFHGYRETQALLAHLTDWNEVNTLTTTSQILISTQSNGSNGIYMYLDRLAEFIRHDPSDGQPGIGLSDADVRGLASGYVHPSVEAENLVNNPALNIFAWNDFDPLYFDDHIKAPLSTTGDLAANGLWYSSLVYYDGNESRLARNWGAVLFDTDTPTTVDDISDVATLDESCFHAHGLHGGSGDNVEACLDSMHVLMNHVTTPVFLAPQLYDFKLKKTGLNNFTKMTDSFFNLAYLPDPGSVCGSHDENFACVEQASCIDDFTACDTQDTKTAEYDAIDFAQRVRTTAQGAVDRAAGRPEESPADVGAPVGHAVFAPEWDTHSGWADPNKMAYQICDDSDAGTCHWQSAPLWAALRSWLELDATVICVEQDQAGTDLNRPLTPWSQTTSGPLLDSRCGPATP